MISSMLRLVDESLSGRRRLDAGCGRFGVRESGA